MPKKNKNLCVDDLRHAEYYGMQEIFDELYRNYKNIPYYTCSAYTKAPCGTLCPSAHRIKAEVVLNFIRETLKDIKKYPDKDNKAFLHSIQNEMEESEKMEIEKKRSRLTDSKNRLQELEHLMCRIYEDMILEKIPNTRYEILNNQYETEQRELSKEIDGLEKDIKRYEKESDRAKKFIRLIERYDNFDELTPTIINEFVEKILVHERDQKGSQTANQKEYEDRYKEQREKLKQEKLKTLKKSGILVKDYILQN